jgi:hypothetical protein
MLATPETLADYDERLTRGKDALREAAHAASRKLDRTRGLADLLQSRRASAGSVVREDLLAAGFTSREIDELLPSAIALAERRGGQRLAGAAATKTSPPRPLKPLPDEAMAPGLSAPRRPSALRDGTFGA